MEEKNKVGKIAWVSYICDFSLDYVFREEVVNFAKHEVRAQTVTNIELRL